MAGPRIASVEVIGQSRHPIKPGLATVEGQLPGVPGPEDAPDYSETGRAHPMKYLMIAEPTSTGFSAYAPDPAGCVAADGDRDETIEPMRETIAFRLEGLTAGEPAPAPSRESVYVDWHDGSGGREAPAASPCPAHSAGRSWRARTTTCREGRGRSAPAPRGAPRLPLERQGDRPASRRGPEVDLADLAQEDQAFDRRGEPVRAGGTFGPRPATRGGSPPSRASRGERPASVWPIRRPSGVRTTTSPRASVPSTWPWIRFVGPRNRATKASAGRL